MKYKFILLCPWSLKSPDNVPPKPYSHYKGPLHVLWPEKAPVFICLRRCVGVTAPRVGVIWALIIGIGSWNPLCYIYNKEPPQ